MKKLSIVFFTLFLLTCTVASAEQLAFEEGGWEVSLNGQFDPKTASGMAIDIEAGLGHFLFDNFEVGGLIGYGYAENGGDNGGNSYMIEVGAFVEYNFIVDWIAIPYVGGSISWRKIDWGADDDNAFILGTRFGVKYFLAENWALDGSLHISFANEDIFMSEGELDDLDFRLSLGIRTYY